MSLLLDTCTFLWMAVDPERLSSAALRALVNFENDVFLSSVSVAEISIGVSRGRLEVDGPVEEWVVRCRSRLHVESLPLTEQAAAVLAGLPYVHRDPFDRLLISQALENDLAIVTPDREIKRYPAPTIW